MNEKGELYVLMKTKDLLGYVTQVTRKSPKVFRFTFVDRLLHLGMDALSFFVEANEIHITSGNWQKRGAERLDLQRKGISKLRTLAYFSMIAQEGETQVLTPKQYLQIAKRVDECIKFAQGWIKSDKQKIQHYLMKNEENKSS
jgi:hypothetical protein